MRRLMSVLQLLGYQSLKTEHMKAAKMYGRLSDLREKAVNQLHLNRHAPAGAQDSHAMMSDFLRELEVKLADMAPALPAVPLGLQKEAEERVKATLKAREDWEHILAPPTGPRPPVRSGASGPPPRPPRPRSGVDRDMIEGAEAVFFREREDAARQEPAGPTRVVPETVWVAARGTPAADACAAPPSPPRVRPAASPRADPPAHV